MDRFPAAIERLGTRTDDVYVHVDLDVLDPSVGRAVGLASYDPSFDGHGAVADVAVSVGRRIAGWIEG